METFKGRPRSLSYPSPPDRDIIAQVKKPNVYSRFHTHSETQERGSIPIEKKIVSPENK